MNNYKALPKWAQQEIESLKKSQSTTKNGVLVNTLTVEHNAVKHSEHTASAVGSMCDAIISISESNINSAKAIQEMAKSLKVENVNMNCEPALNISDVRA